MGLFVGILAISLASLSAVAPPAGASLPGDVSSGLVRGLVLGAQGSFVTAEGVTVNTGLVAPLSMSCVNEVDDLHREVQSFELPLPGTSSTLASLDSLIGDIHVQRSPESVVVEESQTVQSVSLLDGLVTATEVQARVTSVLDESGVHHVFGEGATGTTILSLVVGGVELGPIEPPANTVIPIPLVGHLVLNEQILGRNSIQVNAMHLYVDDPAAPVTGDITISSAATRLRDVRAQLAAEAYSARIATGVPTLDVDTGKLVPIGLHCSGSDGTPQTITAVGIDRGTVLQSGTAVNTVNGLADELAAFAEASAQIEALDIGGGLVTAEAVTAYARTEAVGADLVNTADSTLVNLVVAGQPIDVSVPPNTRIDLPDIGFVVLNGQRAEVGSHVAKMRTRAIEVVVQVEPNPLGLPAGARIIVAEASTSLRA